MNARELIYNLLKTAGYDGLYNDKLQCWCLSGSLCDTWEKDFSLNNCKAGVVRKTDNDDCYIGKEV